jgi:hypothetical protein
VGRNLNVFWLRLSSQYGKSSTCPCSNLSCLTAQLSSEMRPRLPMFRRKVLPPSSGWMMYSMLLADYLAYCSTLGTQNYSLFFYQTARYHTPEGTALRTDRYMNLRFQKVSFIHKCLYSPLFDLGRLFSFVILYTVCRTPWAGDQSVARPLPTHRTTQTQNKGTHVHRCLKWDSNPRPPSSSAGRQFMPWTARPATVISIYVSIN